jgi:hypothetical protein
VPQAAVAATYCEATTATLPTAAVPLLAAETAAAVWLTRAAARKEVAAAVGSMGRLRAHSCLPRPLSISSGAHSHTTCQVAWGGGRGSARHHSVAQRQLQLLRILRFGIATILRWPLQQAAWGGYEPILACPDC